MITPATSPALPPAAVLLSKPGAWGQGALARNFIDEVVSPHDPRACRFCLMGALLHCYCGVSSMDVVKARLYAVLDGRGITAWNDAPERTQEEVVAACVKAGI